MLKYQNPDKEYPSNAGQKWTDEEEKLLLEELSKNTDIQAIAQFHNRTIGGINSRRREIAYKLHSVNRSMEEIILITKLDEYQIVETIKIRETIKKRKNIPSQCKSTTEVKKPFSGIDGINNDIKELKNDIKELKKTIQELVVMIKSVYDFEDAQFKREKV
jgi:adenylosuccinate synthase